MKPEPFRIDVSQAELEDLHRRLRKTRWSSGLRDGGWQLGTSPAYLKDLASYWLAGFDWRKQEASLNAFPHFKADMDGARDRRGAGSDDDGAAIADV